MEVAIKYGKIGKMWRMLKNYDRVYQKCLSHSMGTCPDFSTVCKGSYKNVRYLQHCSRCFINDTLKLVEAVGQWVQIGESECLILQRDSRSRSMQQQNFVGSGYS